MAPLGSQKLPSDPTKFDWAPKSLIHFQVDHRLLDLDPEKYSEDVQKAMFIYRESKSFESDRLDNYNPNKCHPAIISRSEDRYEVAKFTEIMLLNLVSLALVSKF